MAIATLQDLSRTPINYSDEYKKYNELVLKNTALTTVGDSSYLSLSSGINYPATTGGESQLLGLLQTAISTSLLDATKWNGIQTEINSQISTVNTSIATTNTTLNIARTAKLDTGTTNAYAVDTDGTFDLTKDGNTITFIPNNTNTGASTINFDTQSAVTIQKADSTGTLVALEAGDLLKNRPAQLVRRVGTNVFILRPSGANPLDKWINTNRNNTVQDTATLVQRFVFNGEGWVVSLGSSSGVTRQHALKIDGVFVVGSATDGFTAVANESIMTFQRFNSSFEVWASGVPVGCAYVIGNKFDKSTPKFYTTASLATTVTDRLVITGSGWVYSIAGTAVTEDVELVIDGVTVIDYDALKLNMPLMYRYTTGFTFRTESNKKTVFYSID